MSFADTAVRVIREGNRPVRITLAGTASTGDLLGYSSGWVRADGNAGIAAVLVAGEDGVSGDDITAFASAVLEGPTDMTAGGALYLSDTAGGYNTTASTTSEQKVGYALSTTVAMIDPAASGGFGAKMSTSRNFVAADVDDIFFVAPFRCTVTKISEVHAVAAGGTATADIERLQGTEAPGSGDVLLGTTKLDLNGTANTVQSPALTSTAAHLILEVGNRLCVKKASGSNFGSLDNACVTVEYVRA